MDISTEIAAIEVASRGSEVRQPIVDALAKLNSGTLPSVSQSDAGKILKVSSQGEWEVGEKSGYVPTPTGTKNITENGTHDVANYASADVNVTPSFSQSDEGKVVNNGALVAQTSATKTQNGTYDTTLNNEIVINVSGGGGSVLITKSITQNGTYNAQGDGADGYSSVLINVSGGSQLIANWDFTQSLTDSVNGFVATLSGSASQSQDGVIIPSDSSCISISENFKALERTYEIDIGDMEFAGSGHHRFFMVTTDAGLIYRSNGKWSFYGSNAYSTASWATDSSIGDFDYFANSTMKIIIDINGYYHIYKDNILVYEPNLAYFTSRRTSDVLRIGSTSSSCRNVVITGLRVY